MAKKEVITTCRKCIYFAKFGDNAGSCLRYPPVQDGKGRNSIDEPPTVKAAGWCGEHKES